MTTVEQEIEELVKEHLGTDRYETLRAYDMFEHTDWVEYKDNKLYSIVSYFTLEHLDFDMIVTMNRDNVFTLSQWKVISKLLRNRDKEIMIDSDPSNKVLIKGAKKYGGYFDYTNLVFPYNK